MIWGYVAKYSGSACSVDADVAEAYSVGRIMARRSTATTAPTIPRSSITCAAASR